jgi:hypothetical protein
MLFLPHLAHKGRYLGAYSSGDLVWVEGKVPGGVPLHRLKQWVPELAFDPRPFLNVVDCA